MNFINILEPSFKNAIRPALHSLSSSAHHEFYISTAELQACNVPRYNCLWIEQYNISVTTLFLLPFCSNFFSWKNVSFQSMLVISKFYFFLIGEHLKFRELEFSFYDYIYMWPATATAIVLRCKADTSADNGCYSATGEHTHRMLSADTVHHTQSHAHTLGALAFITAAAYYHTFLQCVAW